MELAKNELFFASTSQKFTALAVCFCPSYKRISVIMGRIGHQDSLS